MARTPSGPDYRAVVAALLASGATPHDIERANPGSEQA